MGREKQLKQHTKETGCLLGGCFVLRVLVFGIPEFNTKFSGDTTQQNYITSRPLRFKRRRLPFRELTYTPPLRWGRRGMSISRATALHSTVQHSVPSWVKGYNQKRLEGITKEGYAWGAALRRAWRRPWCPRSWRGGRARRGGQGGRQSASRGIRGWPSC